MELESKGKKSRDNQVEEVTEAELALHRLFGQVAMTISPGTTVARLIENAANDVPLTPELEAFRNGVLKATEEPKP